MQSSSRDGEPKKLFEPEEPEDLDDKGKWKHDMFNIAPEQDEFEVHLLICHCVAAQILTSIGQAGSVLQVGSVTV